MAYCIYLRKSRVDLEAEAKGEGETLARHKKALLELAKRQYLNITEIYHEIVSGETIASRPVMQKLLTEVEQGLWEGVLVMEVERLARGDTMDQGLVSQTFKYSNTKIVTPSKTYDPTNEYDEEYFEFGLFMSRREYKTINRRLQRGRIASAKEGKFVGNVPPYGYIRKKLDKQKGFTLEPESEQSSVVKMVFELYTKGKLQEDRTYRRIGVSLIVRELNSLGIQTIKGGDWVPATIQGMLRNPVYIGKVRWNWRPSVRKIVDGQVKRERPRSNKDNWTLSDGMHEAIIDMDTWELAQEYLANNRPHPAPSQMQMKNPLSGLITCGECGRKMVRRPYNGRQPDTLMCPVTSCSNVSAPLHLVEERVLFILREWLANYKFEIDVQDAEIDKSSVQIESLNKMVVKTNTELEKLKSQMNKLHDFVEDGTYTTETYLERSKIVSERIKTTQERRNKLTEEMNRYASQKQAIVLIIPKIEKVIELYEITHDPAKRNELLKTVIEEVVYLKDSTKKWSKPDEFRLSISPKLPIIS
jgi:site-specific DNA recombinase